MIKGFDVFTPTYNRAYCIKNVYDSLIQQTWKDFTWVVIDDGSLDETKELIEKFIEEGKINIIYQWQENQGRFAAFNTAKQFFQHELVATVDSDDWLLPDGLEKIHACWEKLKDQKNNYAGVVAHFETQDGKLLGSEFPSGLEAEKMYVLYDKYRLQGDKFIVCRNNLIQKYSYPLYKGEKFGGDSLVYNWINDECPQWILREIVAHRDYMPDSITNNLLKNHVLSANGMTDHYNERLRVEKYQKLKIIKHSIGYVAYGLVAGRRLSKVLQESNRKGLTCFLAFPGFLYSLKLRSFRNKLKTADSEKSNLKKIPLLFGNLFDRFVDWK